MQAASKAMGYTDLAALLEYPNERTGTCCRTWLEDQAGEYPDAAERLRAWAEWFYAASLSDAQEVYTNTFDLNPSCPLDVGYYLFGEDYQRGVFLARLRQSQQDAGMAFEAELPDHLPVILRWLERTQGSEEHRDMVGECLVPVLRKMDAAMAPRRNERGDVQGGGNPYRLVIQAVGMVIERSREALG